jgi:hypothetical protein
MNRLEYVLTTATETRPDAMVEELAARLRQDLIPLGVWVVVRNPHEADPGLHGPCSAELQERIDSIVRSIMSAHRATLPSRAH